MRFAAGNGTLQIDEIKLAHCNQRLRLVVEVHHIP